MLEIITTTETARVPVTTMNISGDIDSSNFQIFQARADDLIADGTRHLLLNFQGVAHISSAGLRTIHNIFNRLRSLHKDVNDDELRKRMSAGAYKSPYVKVANLAPNVMEAFKLGGFEIYIQPFDSVEEALKSF